MAGGYSWKLADSVIDVTGIEHEKAGRIHANVTVYTPCRATILGGGRIDLASPGDRCAFAMDVAIRHDANSETWSARLLIVWAALAAKGRVDELDETADARLKQFHMIAFRIKDLAGGPAARIGHGTRPFEDLTPKVECLPEARFAVGDYKGDVCGLVADSGRPLVGEYGEVEIRIMVGHVGMVVVTMCVYYQRNAQTFSIEPNHRVEVIGK